MLLEFFPDATGGSTPGVGVRGEMVMSEVMLNTRAKILHHLNIRPLFCRVRDFCCLSVRLS